MPLHRIWVPSGQVISLNDSKPFQKSHARKTAKFIHKSPRVTMIDTRSVEEPVMRSSEAMRPPVLDLRPGEVVEVRSPSEILSTLDEKGSYESLPFMPEMRKYCGSRFMVLRRIERSCVDGSGIRRMNDTVLLEDLCCDGEGHAGCQRNCPIYWKEAWLKRPSAGPVNKLGRLSKEDDSFRFPVTPDGTHFSCQSTELLKATSPLSPLDPRQYVRDLRVKTYTPRQLARLTLIAIRLRIQIVFLGISSVILRGKRKKTPVEVLNLQPGEFVEVRAKEEIADTLDSKGRNRGLRFSPTMLPFCGGRYRVLMRVNRIIQETTGRLFDTENTVILEKVTCDGHHRWGGCPRNAFHLWREIWLKRVNE
jgi:hypothetical protein